MTCQLVNAGQRPRLTALYCMLCMPHVRVPPALCQRLLAVRSSVVKLLAALLLVASERYCPSSLPLIV